MYNKYYLPRKIEMRSTTCIIYYNFWSKNKVSDICYWVYRVCAVWALIICSWPVFLSDVSLVLTSWPMLFIEELYP